MENWFSQVNITSLILVIAGFAAVLFVYMLVYKWLAVYVRKTDSQWDDVMLDLFKIPILWVLVWIMFKFFTYAFLKELPVFKYVAHVNNILLILSAGWVLVKLVKLVAFLLQKKLDIEIADNLKARRSLTQLKVFQNITDVIIVIITLSFILMTFDAAKIVGQSLLASAGVAGIIIGFAAQKSIGMFLAGIQLAFTQPVRLDDVVVVEGEWGRIEEITFTYVVVKIWDQRRLILPVNYFLEKPFQNWTRTSAEILGSVFLYVGYDLPVKAVREFLSGILKDNENWDQRVANVQVTNSSELYKELRILVSSSDSSKNWNLRIEIREKLIDFIQDKYPGCLARVRNQITVQPKDENLRPDEFRDGPFF